MADLEMSQRDGAGVAGVASPAPASTPAAQVAAVVAPVECGAWPMWVRHHRTCTFMTLLILGIVTIILISVSFTYINWDERGFKRDTTSNQVDTSEVHDNGQKFWGLGFNAILFTNTWTKQPIELEIAASNGQAFRIRTTFYWRIPSRNLGRLFDSFGVALANQVEIRATAAIKNRAPRIDLQRYIDDREGVANELHAALSDVMETLGVNVARATFFLRRIDIPSTVSDINLETAVQTQTNTKRRNEQLAEAERAITEQMRQEIIANTTRSTAEASAEAIRLTSTATSEATRIEAVVDSVGIKSIFDKFNVTDPIVKARFLRFYVLAGILVPNGLGDIVDDDRSDSAATLNSNTPIYYFDHAGKPRIDSYHQDKLNYDARVRDTLMRNEFMRGEIMRNSTGGNDTKSN